MYSPYFADLFVAGRCREGGASDSRSPRRPVLESRIAGCELAVSLGPYLRASSRHRFSVVLQEYKPRGPWMAVPQPRPHVSLLSDLLFQGLQEYGGFALITPIPPKPQEPWEHYHLGDLLRALEASLSDARSRGLATVRREALRFVGAVPPIKTLPPDRRFAAIHGRMEADRVENASVLVVDDVLASGATLREAARALRAGGARRVAAVTLAKRVT